MNAARPLKVMWLLNHSTLRRFEIEQLISFGVAGIYVPKSFPYDEGNLSASVTYDYDADLNIDANELSLLNAQDWYGNPCESAWAIANKYFDVAFIGFFPKQIASVTAKFAGAIVLRAFGLGGGVSYSSLIRELGGESLERRIKSCGARFWFGIGYEHLAHSELNFLAKRSVHLPVGLKVEDKGLKWEGGDEHIYFVCPRIGSSPYFASVYNEFVAHFGDFKYVIGGAQPISVPDRNVLGFVSSEKHVRNMTQSRVMFYHSQEPNHIHYHPFEAISVGMPLIFMGGGMLDRFGGIGLPGRCRNFDEARDKIRRILENDRELINIVRESQRTLLEPVRSENCASGWQLGFRRVLDGLLSLQSVESHRPPRLKLRRRVAVILPISYRGGSLRGALLLARALRIGSQNAGEDVDIVFCHLADEVAYSDDDFAELGDEIARRPFRWRNLNAASARRTMRYAGFEEWEPTSDSYVVPDDGINQLNDCSLWVVVSDRLLSPLLPMRPVVHIVFDYLQRYVSILPNGADRPFLQAVRRASRLLVTTDFTYRDAIQYSGVSSDRVRKVPMLVPNLSSRASKHGVTGVRGDYFIWTTNAAPHKNHKCAIEALRIYYSELSGLLRCKVTGVGTDGFSSSNARHLQEISTVIERSRQLKDYVEWCGDLPDGSYAEVLAGARFLWHPGKIDNGTFSVVEAAYFGVCSLSSDYPAMREMDEVFKLGLVWMTPDSPREMAEKLKYMEQSSVEVSRRSPPSGEDYEAEFSIASNQYWNEIRQCL